MTIQQRKLTIEKQLVNKLNIPVLQETPWAAVAGVLGSAADNSGNRIIDVNAYLPAYATDSAFGSVAIGSKYANRVNKIDAGNEIYISAKYAYSIGSIPTLPVLQILGFDPLGRPMFLKNSNNTDEIFVPVAGSINVSMGSAIGFKYSSIGSTTIIPTRGCDKFVVLVKTAADIPCTFEYKIA